MYLYFFNKLTVLLNIDVEPNHDISEAVNRAIARHTERVDRQIEIVENGFKSINNEIESKILEASQALDKSLNVIDNSLSSILDDQKSVNVNEKHFLIFGNRGYLYYCDCVLE